MYSAGISMDCDSESMVCLRIQSYRLAFSARGAGIERNVSITPPARAASNASLTTGESLTRRA